MEGDDRAYFKRIVHNLVVASNVLVGIDENITAGQRGSESHASGASSSGACCE